MKQRRSMLSVAETARRLHITPQDVREFIERGFLCADRADRVPAEEINRVRANGRANAARRREALKRFAHVTPPVPASEAVRVLDNQAFRQDVEAQRDHAHR